ncbi:S4 domain-containing protein YaaA [Enterococcus canis]|uniref:S4 domain-containing protein YaaA n=1 Tax=Enterococcus canis TaxID=214095 RepID=A0A1L8RES7_9ENTE|nr:S4 domain-containing protein YaaA [Enterococcus canis]
MKKTGGSFLKKTVVLESDYMTLGQFLKEISVISSGGQAKWYLADTAVLVDGEPEQRRGRKLYAGMMVEVPDEGTFFMAKKEETHETE